MGSLTKAAIAAAFSLTIAANASAASSLSNTGHPIVFAPDFSVLGTHTVGQTFKVPLAVPAQNILVDFSLTIGPPANLADLPTGPIYIDAAIYSWDPVALQVVDPVWSDTGTEIDLAGLALGPQTLLFSVNETLDPLLEYVAFLSLANNDPVPETAGSISFAIVTDPSSLPGDFVLSDDPSIWSGGNGYDALFTANFVGPRLVEIPAPAALAIFGLGLAGLGLTFRRREV